ncbi:hypothetical protein ACN4EG_15450 [Alkalinema pantanalense CENA528]|uniref:hypothetical protein n=1 Tax=Alkalinema pantanalense TaxID=1620705 RepID=UPI003D6DC0A5
MRQFYTGLIEWSNENTSHFRVCWLWAATIGEALADMINCAIFQGIQNPTIRQFDPYRFTDLPMDKVDDCGNGVFWSKNTYSFPEKANYQLPYGVVASCLEGKHNITDIQVGYQLKCYEQLTELTVVTEADACLSLYIQLLCVLPELSAFLVTFQHDWENYGVEEVYVCDKLVAPQSINAFLNHHYIDIFLNGHLTLTSYANQGETNISIDDHKLILVSGYDESVIQLACRCLEKYGIFRKNDLVTIQSNIYHWHYKHPEGRARKDLTKLLKKAEFAFSEALSARTSDPETL